MRRQLCGICGIWLVVSVCRAGEIGFLEDFALGENREEALKQLIPGTRDHYYYHCLHYQNTGRLDEVDRMLKLWIKRYNRTGRVEEIENRQALLRYATDPGGSLEFLRRRLGLRFDHQRKAPGEKPRLPTSLDQSLISRETLTARALGRHKDTLGGFEDRALDWVTGLDLSPERRRHLLRRLERPDHSTLPRLVVDDLNYKHSRGFGSLGIHRRLLLKQLDECLKLKPDLLNQTQFANAYLAKLWPNPDVDWRQDASAREAFLGRLWSFVSRLDPAHNSLKAHVLYHRLVHDRALGIHDRGRFMTYIRLPRNAPYISRELMGRSENRRYSANLTEDYREVTLLPPVGNDEPLVRSFLEHFFLTDESYEGYGPYIRDEYLKRRFAETKILAGLGDMERWYSMLSPAEYKALKERVDLDFAHTNKILFMTEEQVSLDLFVKNVRTLIVKVFEINTLNYYRANQREVDTAIDLDGLVAEVEKTYSYTEPPLRRIKRHFEFSDLGERGTYVIEFIGNGKSSRALVRRGTLRFLVRDSVAGHIFTILDGSNSVVPNAGLWLGGQYYSAGDDGTIAVPFSNKPGRRPIVLVDGGFASLDFFQHNSENYRLTAGIHVDRESLVSRKKAAVIVRPAMTLNAAPVGLSVLEDVTLVMTSTDREGISTTKEVKDFKLHEDRESIHEFQVPANLSGVTFSLKAKVENLSKGKKEDLKVEKSFTLNGIDATEKIEDLHLGQVSGRYVLDLLGKTGELKPHRPVELTLKHRDFRDAVAVSLKTDGSGRISLGKLAGIDWVSAKGPEGTQHRWYLAADRHSLPSTIHGRAGETLLVPYVGSADRPLRSEFSLLELRGATFVRDRFDALAMGGGYLRVRGLPAGDYDLYLKRFGRLITVRLTAGEESLSYVLSGYRQLEVRNPRPLQIAAVEPGKETVNVRLENASKLARLHVFATRYLPEYAAYDNLGSVGYPEPYAITVRRPETRYVVGRDIGDEYRYILERKYATTYPGNLLKRPSLLLNPWAIRSTETGRQEARRGGVFDRAAERTRGERGRAASAAGVQADAEGGGFSSLDFLGRPAAVLTNLRPDERGVVSIRRADLGRGQHLHFVAVDPEDTVYRQVSLEEVDGEFADLRLADGLDPGNHYTEQKKGTVVKEGARFTLSDITTSDFEVYDSLDRVYALLVTLSGDPTLVEFGFIRDWPSVKPEEKREKYSRYACHELNFFLFRKDPEFFREVVRPYLDNKHDKTFLDHWLLGDDLRDYLKPWAHGRLNIVERILLAQRMEGERPRAARHVEDLFDLLPLDIERLARLFKTALRGRALDTDDDFGVKAARATAEGRPAESRRRLQSLARRSRKPKAPVAAALAAEAEGVEKLAEEALDSLADKEEDLSLAIKAEDKTRRGAVRQLYRKLDKTREWVENNYYHLPIERQNADLITVNGFWRDYARHDGEGPFFSTRLGEASRNFAEMMFALAVLDLPFKSGEHQSAIAGAQFTLDAASSLVVFHKEIKEAQPSDEQLPILVSQNFYRHGDRYRHVGGERFDKYISDEFLVHTPYGCHVVITNPTSSRQKLDVLLQVPRGAIPVLGGQYTRSVHVVLEPYHTWTHDYVFYFPAAGECAHYPVHVAKNEKLVAFAQPATLKVVETPSRIDRESWDYISQDGTQDEVIAFLEERNLGRIDLGRIAWRMRDASFFDRVLGLLSRRHVYNHSLWSYGIHHNEPAAIREYLLHSDHFVNRCGAAVRSELLIVDPVERKTYQHMEYWPLVNARAHRLGKTRSILNNRFYQQYQRFLTVLSCRPELDDGDVLGITYYLLLQDRIEEALAFFERIRPHRIADKLQYDYLAAYVGFYTEDLRRSRSIAARYAEYPVDRWRLLFANVAAQLDEIEGPKEFGGEAPEVVDADDRTQRQTRLAATEAGFEFEVEARKIVLRYQNLERCRVNYYLMDIELLFSRNPFVQQYSGQFDYIRPNMTVDLELDPARTEHTFALPERFHSSNVLIEILSAGVKKSEAYFANTLALQVVENYAQVRVANEETRKPLPKVYVKVYARMKDGKVRFYKDGYTDLRGRFDYGSLSTNEVEHVGKFSILVLSRDHGALVREADPPQL